MKTLIVLATLGLTGFLGAGAANADEGARRPDRDHRRPRHEFRHPRPAPAPRSERCWIAPRYERIVVGRDHCGVPIYRTVCVSEGHWDTCPARCD